MERCSEIWIKNPQEYKGKWGELFKNDNPIHIEIGCGKGNFVVGMAKKYPDLKIEMNFDSKIVDLIEEKFDAGNYKQPFRSSETVSDKKENLFYYTETDDTGNFFAAARCSWIWIVFCVSETSYTSSNRK
jgi:tRNA (guanine-N7-)-methyltransferase